MIDKSFIEKIEDLVEVKLLEINGLTYSDKPLSLITKPTPSSLTISTLTGLVDYVEQNPDKLEIERMVIHVASHREVNLFMAIEPDSMKRKHFISAEFSPCYSFNFGQFLKLETFVIALQSLFVQDDNTGTILKIVGNIKDGEVRSFSDDGTTQEVKAKQGITIVNEVAVPNPVTLSPYRTFPEIEQPESRFVLRLTPGNPVPSCALFEAEGSRWKLEAIHLIRDWLKEQLPNNMIIIA